MEPFASCARSPGMADDPIPVLVNRGGGAASRHGEALRDLLEQAFAAAGRTIALDLVDGADMVAAAAQVADRPLVVVGGGDVTIVCAAGALLKAGGMAALGVLPLGTRNHLAGELGMPADLAAAAQAIVAGEIRRIDVGRVNGRLFVNNAAVGLYPELVRGREERQERGLPKWLANAPATWEALKRLRHHRLRLRLPGSTQAIRTPLLFIGNNRYELELGRVGQRAALDDGVLSIYALGRSSRVGLIRTAIKTALGRADPDQDFAAIGEADRFEVDVHAGAIDVALDGEVVRLASPLCFSIDAGALPVKVPKESAA